MRTRTLSRPSSQLGITAALLLTIPASPALGELSLLTSPGQFTHDAFIDWTDTGPPGTNIPTPAFFIDVKDTALAARVSEAPTADIDGFQRLQNLVGGAGPGFDFWSAPGFDFGEHLLSTTGNKGGQIGVTGQNTGNMGFDFSQPVFGFGVDLIYGVFEVDVLTRIEAFDNNGDSLGFIDVNAPGSSTPGNRFQTGPAEFFGIRSDSRNIASILYTPLLAPGAHVGPTIFGTPLVETGIEPANPSGQSPEAAILPTLDTPREEDGAWVFDDVTGTGRWFDPPMTEGYIYEVTDELSNFVAVELPTTIGDADNQFVIEDNVNGITVVNGGDLHVFDTPVDAFTVTGIDPLVDGGDPQAFPTFLQFDQLTVSFTQTPVPEPGSLSSLAIVFGLITRRRRRG